MNPAPKRERLVLLVALGALVLCAIAEENGAPARHPRLQNMTTNVWVKLHEQKEGDACVFKRQAHGGSCFDGKRNELILFGSNTHSKDWKNSPFIFNPEKMEWRRLYADDPVGAYTVTEQGIPVAGVNGNHPWATHTFGCVVYDRARDEIVIACWPAHMQPTKWGHAVKHLWGKIKKHPNWTLNLNKKTWEALPGEARHFFPHCAAMDTDRNVLLGCGAKGIFELGGEPRLWKRIASKRYLKWHDNCAYDSKHKALIVFGSVENSNDIETIMPETGLHKKMPTLGPRPPKDQHNPMAFAPSIGQTVILIDRTKRKDGAENDTTETWLYDLGQDAWRQIESATLPFACGMNYNMEYDSRHKALLLVTGGYRGATTVWALKPRL